MKEHPILFNGEMVRAILDGRKTQTRRIMKYQCEFPDNWNDWSIEAKAAVIRSRSPYQPGDVLWVRETICSPQKYIVGYKATAECGAWIGDGEGGRIWNHHGYIIDSPAYKECFKAPVRTWGIKKYGGKWIPSIHMPRWACRIFLEVTGVRVERVQDITPSDCVAEMNIVHVTADVYRHAHSIDKESYGTPRRLFHQLWDSIYDKRGHRWETNPWVWVTEFKQITREAEIKP